MGKINKFNEYFDNEELASMFDVPNLKGEMSKEISKFKKVDMLSGDENSDSFTERVLFKYPILNKYRHKSVRLEEVRVNSFYGTSLDKLEDGNEYFINISLYYDDLYNIQIIMYDLNDNKDQSKWVINEFNFENIEDSFTVIDGFFEASTKLGILKPESRFDVRNN